MRRTDLRFFAIRNGDARGVYTSWEEARERLRQHPSLSSSYKGFRTREAATAWIGGCTMPPPRPHVDLKRKRVMPIMDQEVVVHVDAWVDGATLHYSLWFAESSPRNRHFSRAAAGDESDDTRLHRAELLAVLAALAYCPPRRPVCLVTRSAYLTETVTLHRKRARQRHVRGDAPLVAHEPLAPLHERLRVAIEGRLPYAVYMHYEK
jgi:hypothetical protein